MRSQGLSRIVCSLVLPLSFLSIFGWLVCGTTLGFLVSPPCRNNSEFHRIAVGEADDYSLVVRVLEDDGSFGASARNLKDSVEEAQQDAEDAAKEAAKQAEDAAKDAAKQAEDAAKATEDAAEARAALPYLYTHAGLMIVGWGLVLPSGVIIARLARHRPGGLWFKFHRILQISGLVIVFVAWMVAMNLFDDVEVPDESEQFEDLHKTLGLIVMVCGLLQPVNAFVRPHAPKEGEDKPPVRLLWEILHKGVGYSAVVLAVFTILLGTTLLPTADLKRKFRLAYGVGVGGLLLTLIVALCVDKLHFKPPPPADPPEEPLSPSTASVDENGGVGHSKPIGQFSDE